MKISSYSCLILIVFSILLIKHFLVKLCLKKSKAIHIAFFNHFITVIVLMIAIYIALLLNNDTDILREHILTNSGLIIAVLTFTAQRTLGNIISGLAISVSKPFKLGDKIQLKNTAGLVFASGRIESIGLHHIVIRNYSGDSVIVTNTELESSIIVNSDYDEGYNQTEYIVIDRNSDYFRAEGLLKEILIENNKANNKNKNTDIIYRIVDRGIQLQYNVRTDNVEESFKICSDIKKQILTSFKNAGINIVGG